jgi:hypothetical protein
VWRPLLEAELLRRAGRNVEARRLAENPPPADAPAGVQAFMLFYRVNFLIELSDPFAALDLLMKFPRALDDEARVTLLLDAYATSHSSKLQQLVGELLAPQLTPTNLAVVKILCAHLIRHPDAAIFERMFEKLQRDRLVLNTDTAGIWFSLLCAAGAVGDKTHLHQLTAQLKQASRTPFVALSAVEGFFRGETAERRITAFLPILPLPLEVTYALHERYAPVAPLASAASKRK